MNFFGFSKWLDRLASIDLSVWTSTAIALAAFTYGTSKSDIASERYPAAEVSTTALVKKAQLPDHIEWDRIERFSQSIEFSLPGLKLLPSSGGTSVYAVISINKLIVGAVLPENTSTVLSGEIMTFNLARALGIANLYQPGFYFFLTGKNLERFSELVDGIEANSSARAENKENIQARIKKYPDGIHAIYKQFGTKPKDYDDLIDSNTLNRSHILPGSSRSLASLLQCNGAQPSADMVVTINGGKSNELAVAKQLSSIFLIDALTLEWDRFSGGNLQTLTENGVVRFVAFDNGGTWSDNIDGTVQNFLSLVSRFDAPVAKGILEMDDFFKRGTPFRGLRNEKEFLQAMGIEKFPEVLPKFKRALGKVAEHLRKNTGCTFN